MADRYAPDAVLLPTVSHKIRDTHAEIVDYFEHFLENEPVGKKIETIVEAVGVGQAEIEEDDVVRARAEPNLSA